MKRHSLLASAALAMAATAAAASGVLPMADRGESVRGWLEPPAPKRRHKRYGNNKSTTKHGRERARAKVAAKSRRDQRKRGKR